MARTCKQNTWLKDGFALAFQVVFIFAFLTLFFFLYVVKVEKAEFEGQMNFIVDELMSKDIEGQLSKLHPAGISDLDLATIINGAIDVVEFRAGLGAEGSVKDVLEQNNTVRGQALRTMSIVVGTMVVVSGLTVVVGYCIPLRHQVIEALWIIVFVGLTELVFLQVIAKNYISADPNKVKRLLGATVEKWVKDRKQSS